MKTVSRTQLLIAALFALVLPFGAVHAKSDAAATVQLPAKGVEKQFMTSIYPMNTDALVNVVIDTGKVAKPRKGSERNYSIGTVPRTIVAKARNGDDKPLKALIVGEPKVPGATVRARPLALIIQKIGDKQNTVLVATTQTTIYGAAQNLDDIEALTPGTLAQLMAAFPAAKTAKGADISYELKDRKETIRFLGNVISDFDNAYIKESDKRPLDAKGNPQLYAWPGARNIGE